jgi:hypothetical protein
MPKAEPSILPSIRFKDRVKDYWEWNILYTHTNVHNLTDS